MLYYSYNELLMEFFLFKKPNGWEKLFAATFLSEITAVHKYILFLNSIGENGKDTIFTTRARKFDIKRRRRWNEVKG